MDRFFTFTPKITTTFTLLSFKCQREDSGLHPYRTQAEVVNIPAFGLM